jgi:hypothetical protein
LMPVSLLKRAEKQKSPEPRGSVVRLSVVKHSHRESLKAIPCGYSTW